MGLTGFSLEPGLSDLIRIIFLCLVCLLEVGFTLKLFPPDGPGKCFLVNFKKLFPSITNKSLDIHSDDITSDQMLVPEPIIVVRGCE